MFAGKMADTVFFCRRRLVPLLCLTLLCTPPTLGDATPSLGVSLPHGSITFFGPTFGPVQRNDWKPVIAGSQRFNDFKIEPISVGHSGQLAQPSHVGSGAGHSAHSALPPSPSQSSSFNHQVNFGDPLNFYQPPSSTPGQYPQPPNPTPGFYPSTTPFPAFYHTTYPSNQLPSSLSTYQPLQNTAAIYIPSTTSTPPSTSSFPSTSSSPSSSTSSPPTTTPRNFFPYTFSFFDSASPFNLFPTTEPLPPSSQGY